MSTTTDILFNSPALHSLKRDQLVKLCKVHGVKASGKNVDLVEKLKLHARSLPVGSPLSVATRSETLQSGKHLITEEKENQVPELGHIRKSEQWEIVMDSIAEEEDELEAYDVQNADNMREFGNNSGKMSIGSSIKSLVSSLGLKQKSSMTPDSVAFYPALSSHPTKDPFSIPYSSLPEPSSFPQTDHFTFDATSTMLSKFDFTKTVSPIPGHHLRPGIPAPRNARLSMNIVASTPRKGPTTTLRLVSNDNTGDQGQSGSSTPKLHPFPTQFEIMPQSPSHHLQHLDKKECNETGSLMNSGFSPGRPGLTGAEPFIFGSPDPKYHVSNDQFRAAASNVLSEMNERLRSNGIDAISPSVLHRHADSSTAIPLVPVAEESAIRTKFDRAHDALFKKMESIDSKRRRVERLHNSSNSRAEAVCGQKRKTSAATNGVPHIHTTVISPRDTDALTKETCHDQVGGGNPVKRQRLEFVVPGKSGTSPISDGNELKDREAIRKKLQQNRVKRRSSTTLPVRNTARRRSVHDKKAPTTKLARPGFWTSTAKLVRNVWTRSHIDPNAAQKPPIPVKSENHPVSLRDNQVTRNVSKSGKGSRLPQFQTGSSHTQNKITAMHGDVTTSMKNATGSMGQRVPSASSIASRHNTVTSSSSRLLAPTASSLAKISRNNVRVSLNTKSVQEVSTTGNPNTPLPSFNGSQRGSLTESLSETRPVRTRSISGRRPRISRSKVIAKLASKRPESGTEAIKPLDKRVRSSLGAKATARISMNTGRGPSANELKIKAKKRARQSEHLRRQSKLHGNISLSNEQAG